MFEYTYDALIEPTFNAIRLLGGSATNSEIIDTIINILQLSDEEIDDIHRGSTTKLEYRTAWAKTYLKKAGYITNSSRGVWTITELGNRTEKLNVVEIKKEVQLQTAFNNKSQDDILDGNFQNQDTNEESQSVDIEDTEIDELDWQNNVLEIVKSITPLQFEKLCQRLLRELGFVNVEVSQGSRDDGIDGKGILKIGKVLSFHVVFQAKRYSGSVGAPIIRDFRGAMDGRAEKGLIITTGSFTRDAMKEALRPGAIQIDLIDGNDLAEHLKQLGLGIEVRMVEKVQINKEWFTSI